MIAQSATEFRRRSIETLTGVLNDSRLWFSVGDAFDLLTERIGRPFNPGRAYSAKEIKTQIRKDLFRLLNEQGAGQVLEGVPAFRCRSLTLFCSFDLSKEQQIEPDVLKELFNVVFNVGNRARLRHLDRMNLLIPSDVSPENTYGPNETSRKLGLTKLYLQNEQRVGEYTVRGIHANQKRNGREIRSVVEGVSTYDNMLSLENKFFKCISYLQNKIATRSAVLEVYLPSELLRTELEKSRILSFKRLPFRFAMPAI